MYRVFRIILQAAKETPREFFLPLIGIYRGIKREYRLLDRFERINRVRNSID